METQGDKKQVFDVSKGILLAFFSGAMLSCVTVIVKYLTNIHPGQLVVYRFWASAALSLPPIVLSGENIFGPPGYRSYITLRAILTSVAIFFQFLSFRYLPVGEAAVLISTTPVFVTIAAKLFLKEPFGLLQTISLLTTGIGIVLITGLHKTGSDNARIYTTEDIYGFSAGLVAVLSITGTYTIARKCKHVSLSVFLFNSSMAGFLGSAITTAATGSFSLHYRGFQQILITVLGFVSYLAIMALLLSLQYMEAGPSATMRSSSDILFSFLWQTFLFSHAPGRETIVGALLVSVSIFLLGLHKTIKNMYQYLKESRSLFAIK